MNSKLHIFTMDKTHLSSQTKSTWKKRHYHLELIETNIAESVLPSLYILKLFEIEYKTYIFNIVKLIKESITKYY